MAYIMLILVAVVTTALINMAFFPTTRHLWRENRSILAVINAGCVLICSITLVVVHHRARTMLAPVEAEFINFAETTVPVYWVLPDERKVLVYAPSDDQRLKQILAKRDRLLQKAGYLMVGDWKITGLVWKSPGTPDIWSAAYLPWR